MTDLTKRIMRRVYLIWFFRQVFNAVTAKLALVFLFMWQFTLYVSVPNVIANWHADWDLGTSFTFLQSAVMQTEFTVQILMLGIVFVSALLLRDILVRRRLDGSRLFLGI